MALTNLNTLGAAIRAKVGETEKKSLPELTEIVEDELVKPTGTKTITENGENIDVAEYAKADVNIPNLELSALNYAMQNANTNALTNFGAVFSRMVDVPFVIDFGASNQSLVTLFLNQTTLKSCKIATTNVTNFNAVFSGCTNLEQVTILGETGQITNWQHAFNQCPNLRIINGVLDLTHASNVSYMFAACPMLEEVRFAPNSITTVGNIYLYVSNVLSKESVLSTLRGLSNLSEQTTQTFSFNGGLTYDSTDADVKAEIANAVTKNWIIKFGSRTPTGE